MPQFSNSTMMRLLRGCILLCYIVTVNSKSITPKPPPGNYIIHKEYIPNLSRDDIISISSNVAITIQRYSDDDQFTEDQQPVQGNEAMVVVTTNCQSHREFKPTVTLEDTNDSGDISSINVQIEDSDDIMYPFMFLRDNQSSSYHVEWPIRKNSPSCRSFRYGKQQSMKRLKGSRSLLSSSIAHQHLKGYWSSLSATVKTDEQKVTDNNLVTLSNTCIVNVDILLNGCAHAEIDVSAPNNQFTNEKAVRSFNSTKLTNTEQRRMKMIALLICLLICLLQVTVLRCVDR